jgi:hypothetical protein
LQYIEAIVDSRRKAMKELDADFGAWMAGFVRVDSLSAALVT